MQQTTNYQLNQWDPEDRILRTDFNADNEKIDAALHGLEQRVGLKTLMDTYVTPDTATVDFSFEGIDWSQWKVLHIYAMAAASSGAYRIGYQTASGLVTFGADRYNSSVRLMVFPLYNGQSPFRGVIFNKDYPAFSCYDNFNEITALSLSALNTDAVILSGKVQIYGEA